MNSVLTSDAADTVTVSLMFATVSFDGEFRCPFSNRHVLATDDVEPGDRHFDGVRARGEIHRGELPTRVGHRRLDRGGRVIPDDQRGVHDRAAIGVENTAAQHPRRFGGPSCRGRDDQRYAREQQYTSHQLEHRTSCHVELRT
jgi:hypothetical protein